MFELFPSGRQVKTKKPPPSGSGLINFVNESKPDCRAGQQRVRKQQVQIAIHASKLVLYAPLRQSNLFKQVRRESELPQ
jgi:hypothetical protein